MFVILNSAEYVFFVHEWLQSYDWLPGFEKEALQCIHNQPSLENVVSFVFLMYTANSHNVENQFHPTLTVFVGHKEGNVASLSKAQTHDCLFRKSFSNINGRKQ